MARPPVDPRLWRHARSARRYLVLSVGLSLVTTIAIVAAAVLLGRVLAGVVTDPGQRSVGAWQTELALLAAAVAVRTLAAWWQARIAHRAGARVVAELEQAVLAAGASTPIRELEQRRTEIAVVVGSGLDGLRPYLTGYVPALLLAVLVPPVVWSVIAAHDLTSAVIVLITLPLIPIFMVLIGLLTEGRARATLDATTRLSDQLLDLFAGMPTLRALGRETGTDSAAPGRTMSGRVRELGESLHRRTMSALRIAFLSSMVLELLATLSVALVAVAIGMRLVHGDMGLYPGVVALVLAPEVYLPLRTVGERFHAAQDGAAAAEKAFAILEPTPARPDTVPGRESAGSVPGREMEGSVPGRRAEQPVPCGEFGGSVPGTSKTPREAATSVRDTEAPVPAASRADISLPRPGTVGTGMTAPDRAGGIELRDLTVESRDGAAPDGLWAHLRPGAVTALTGPNGSGKSTVLHAVAGLIAPTRGAILADGTDIRQIPAAQWWQRLAWLPQRPVLVPGTLRENLELLGATADPAPVLDAACTATGFDAVLAALPDGWDTVVGFGGVGLSLGQRQRLALTRVLAAGRPLVLLDEPTAHLDAESEAAVARALTELARTGTTVVVVAHRPALLSAADRIVAVPSTAGRVAR